MYPPANSWYAWTPDAFVASKVQNCLYWKGGANRWFTGTKIYKFDCDTHELSLFINLEEEGANWKLYGCAIGVHPTSDEIYMALYHEFGTPTYITRRYSPDGEKIRDYEMIMNYWFPSLPVFPSSDGNSGNDEIITDDESGSFNNEKGNLYNMQGILISNNVNYGEWGNIPAGLYIWKTAHSSIKTAIR